MRPPESFVAQPIRSLQTMLRIIAEDDVTLPTLVPDGIYGQETINAINAFQNKYNLPPTGIADQATWEALVEAYEDAFINIGKAEPIEILMDPGQIFQLGDSSPYLYLLQSMLLYLSLSEPTITTPPHNGMLDASTSNALKGFQILAGLTPTGTLDKKTWKYLVNQFTLSVNRNLDGNS